MLRRCDDINPSDMLRSQFCRYAPKLRMHFEIPGSRGVHPPEKSSPRSCREFRCRLMEFPLSRRIAHDKKEPSGRLLQL